MLNKYTLHLIKTADKSNDEWILCFNMLQNHQYGSYTMYTLGSWTNIKNIKRYELTADFLKNYCEIVDIV